SEERCVGEECRSRWAPDYLKKKKFFSARSPAAAHCVSCVSASASLVARAGSESRHMHQAVRIWPTRVSILLFFFQAEDGIRDSSVTGVQTCALPISTPHSFPLSLSFSLSLSLFL